MKNLYKGIFQTGCKIKTFRRYAHSEEQAKLLMCMELAKESNLPLWQVQQYFKDSNYAINLEMEFKEMKGGE